MKTRCYEMNKNKRDEMNKSILTSLRRKNKRLNEQYELNKQQTTQLQRKVNHMEHNLTTYKKSRLIRMMDRQRMKQSIRNIGAYLIGRRNIKRIYSLSYKRKQASNDLLPYVRSLYEEGFIEKALEDLETKFIETTNKTMKRAIAMELALFYANKETVSSAKRALQYV